MAEWLNAIVCKTIVLTGYAGSNPAPCTTLEKEKLMELFSKGEENLPEDLLNVIEQICLINKKVKGMSDAFSSREWVSDQEYEKEYDKRDKLFSQIEGLLGLDTDYEIDDGVPQYQVDDSEVLVNMRKYLPCCYGCQSFFILLPNGVVIRFGFGTNPRLGIYRNLEEASSAVIGEIEEMDELEKFYNEQED